MRTAAGIVLAGTNMLKSLGEAATGQIVLASLHTGDLVVPIVESHLGGVAGGIIGFILIRTPAGWGHPTEYSQTGGTVRPQEQTRR